MIGHMKQIGAALAVTDARETPFAGRLSTSGARGVVMVPITVGNRVWGAMLAAGYEPWPRTKPIVERLQRFAELAALAVENTEARVSLQRQAATDGTTGLAHSAAFTDRLARQVARSRRDGRAFCLAVFDVDRFKAVNDSHGHALGDEALRLLATCLQDHCRTGDLAGRTGGDEFAMLLVDCDRAQCLAVVERIRQRIASLRIGADVTIRVSAGIAEWRPGLDADTIFRQADDALYWAKANGRDTAWIYDPAVVLRLDPEARRDRVERGHALAALRALARAIDAKDVSTREHAERVAEISLHIARELGWSEDRSALLHEAALLHDVGKIGVPDAILLKPERLDPAEYDEVKRHAALGAEITEGVLTSEQVLWVRSHHERPDGRGYPDGLVDDELAEGAAILALADTWDVMTSVRPYSPPKATAAALRECRELVGRQFRADVVAALERLVACQRVGGARAAA
jgi:diguanylate cyclase (GGDEF)-like protein/putative nucleotidyltransferase with HDIG domain